MGHGIVVVSDRPSTDTKRFFSGFSGVRLREISSLTVFQGPLQVFQGLLQVFQGLLQVFQGLLQVHYVHVVIINRIYFMPSQLLNDVLNN